MAVYGIYLFAGPLMHTTRLAFATALIGAAFTAQAQTLEVSVIQGDSEPVKYHIPVSDHREQIDLRESHNYPVAFVDPATKREICREGVYQTGLLLTLRPIDRTKDAELPLEVIGQISTLDKLQDGKALTCGTDQSPVLSNKPFSDTLQLMQGRPKILVIDNAFTVIVSLK